MSYHDNEDAGDLDAMNRADAPVNLRCAQCDHMWTSDEGDDECPECGSGDTTPERDAGVQCRHCGATCHGEAFCHRCGDRVHYAYDALSTSPMNPFADPGGNSALRAASARNPRIFPCPECGEPDRLTSADRALGYRCDDCADRAERGGP